MPLQYRQYFLRLLCLAVLCASAGIAHAQFLGVRMLPNAGEDSAVPSADSGLDVLLLGAPDEGSMLQPTGVELGPDGEGVFSGSSVLSGETGRRTALTQNCSDQDKDGVCDSDDKCEATPEGAAVLPNGCHLSKKKTLRLEGLYFDNGRATLKPSSTVSLEAIVGILTQRGDVRVEIGGHADSIGSPAQNLLLSRNRARAVYNYLVTRGIDAGRLEYKGYGSGRPIARDVNDDGSDNPRGRALNRRVELTVIE